MQRIYGLLNGLNLAAKTLPGITEMIDGSKLTQLRDVNISDLLGREEINIDTQQVMNMIAGKVALVTGAGGSIGSELSRQVLKREPAKLILMDRTENALFHIHRKLVETDSPDRIVPFLCDVCDSARVNYAFEKFKPDLVFHAAAHKHVPMQELNAIECFRNNVGGIRVLAKASHDHEVSSFLLVSTDKAVNPTSVMGASKRACELYCQAFGKVSRTKFLSVRFGNVLASQGSVVPIFMDQIANGGPVTVTHPEMRRYFMTIPEAVTLILQATALGESGQLMVLEMGEPIKILDLVHHLLMLMGKDRNSIPITFIGLRPGEKMFEEISFDSETYLSTAHSKIKIFNHCPNNSVDVISKIDLALNSVASHQNDDKIRSILKEIVPEYTGS
jgi:FlaA1/EpsC-like NDP-sugar epimerase